MNKTLQLYTNFIIFGVTAGLLAILILLIKSSFLNGNDTITLAITADLLFTVPLVYFLLIRKSRIPKTTVIPVMLAGLLIGTYFLPKESQNYLTLFKTWGLPLIEFSILTYIVIKVRKAIKKYKDLPGEKPDFFTALKDTCSEILPKKLVFPFATEVAVFYYGFVNWKTRIIKENEFTYHKNSSTPSLLAVFIMLIGIEALAFHLLLARWSIVVAWIFTALSVYTAIQVFGFTKSLFKRPISINRESLVLKYGILNEVEIPFSDIDRIELSTKELEKDKLTKSLSPFGEIENHNLVIYLTKEHELVGLYGMRKKFKVITVHIDEPKEFLERTEKALHRDIT